MSKKDKNSVKEDEKAMEGISTEEGTEEKPHKGNIKVLVIEGVIAVAALGFIGYAIGNSVSKKNNTVSENTVSGSEISSELDLGADAYAAIDNSDLDAARPAVPLVDARNTITEAEAKSKVEDGSMISYTLSTGQVVYMVNYQDPDLLLELSPVTEEEVEDFINEDFLSKCSVMEKSDKTTCENGDTVNIDFVGKRDGVAFDGGTGSDYNLILGSHSFITGFEEGLVGCKVGDVVDLELSFPADYWNADLAGAPVVFTVTINGIMEEVFPELTDELVQENFSDITTADECRKMYREGLIKNKLATALADPFYIDKFDEALVDAYYDAGMLYYINMSSAYYGESVSSALGLDENTLLEFTGEMMDYAAENAVSSMIFNAIAEQEGIEVTDADVEALAAEYGYASVAEFYEYYGSEYIIRDSIIAEKVMDKLLEIRGDEVTGAEDGDSDDSDEVVTEESTEE